MVWLLSGEFFEMRLFQSRFEVSMAAVRSCGKKQGNCVFVGRSITSQKMTNVNPAVPFLHELLFLAL
jgi:hypothetical protein